jgi:hypothetical protein
VRPQKKPKKSLAMPAGIVTNGVILRDMGGTMRKFKTRSPRTLPFRLFLVLAGALMLMGAFVPQANATVLVYWNFEDAVTGGAPDLTSDVVGAPDFNPGGGLQLTTITIGGPSGDFASGPGLLNNRTAGDIDTADPGQAIAFRRSSMHNGTTLTFGVGATFFQNMTLSYATNNNGNGFTTHTWNFSTNGGATFTQFAQFTGLTGTQVLSAALPAAANNQGALVIQIVLTGGQSNGNDLQTIIDNIQLTGTVIPEPATVAGGLLGVLGLCWHQRRRLIRSVRLRRT